MDARRQRSRGLATVNRLTGWMAGGALVASGAFVVLLARPSTPPASTTPPNGSTDGGTSVTSPPPTTSSPTLDPNATASGDGSPDTAGSSVATMPLNPPVQRPRPSTTQPQVSSGAS